MLLTTKGVPKVNSTRRTAIIIGVLYLAALFSYGIGTGLLQSALGAADRLAILPAHQPQFLVGATLMLANSLVVVCNGVLFFPILNRHNSAIAVGYVATRIIEAALLAVGIIGLLLLPGLGEVYASSGDAAAILEALGSLAVTANELCYQVAMAALGIGSLFFCALLHRTRLVPPWMALWGFAGYAVFAAGAILELLGVGVGLLLSIPGGLFEVTFGVWLIVKGFKP